MRSCARASRLFVPGVAAVLALAAAPVGVDADEQGAGTLVSRVGIVYRDAADALRLTIADGSLSPGRSVEIVTEEATLCCAIVKQTAVQAADASDPVYLDDEAAKATYLLDADGIGTDMRLGFGIPEQAAESAKTRADLTGDGTPERMRICAGGEGLHLTIWNGEPLTGERLWHAYFYLGYDAEPDCQPQDYE